MLRIAFLIHFVSTLYVAKSQHIDTFEPLMRASPEMDRFPDDFFGYTAVLHQTNTSGGMNTVRIVVSAPYGQATRPGMVTRLPRVIGIEQGDATGVIYTCSITPGDCEGLIGDDDIGEPAFDGDNDQEGQDRRLYDVDDNRLDSGISDTNFVEQKRGQFLGATLKSTGDFFMTCAHRHLDYGVGLDRNPYGVCYYSGRSLRGFSRYTPCSTSSRSFFGHGQCQAGSSGDVINGNILVGAPGTFAWRGAVFRRSTRNVHTSSGNGVGTEPISWQGYEVITGRINSQTLEFIVSVPRFNNYRGRVNVYANNNDELRPVGNPPLAGEQTGSYYGFSMAAVDLQNQGLDDLLVGAPMHSVGTDPELGRVYVYRNTQGSLSLFNRLEGRIRYGRFGHAMARLGDINGDSFEDVAISAPFGEDSSGNSLPGTVYIYAGAGDQNIINPNPIQTIVGSSLNLNTPQSFVSLRNGSFGSSLSSNVDVDGNGYNDLVIGAFRSQQVFMLRTRPVARVVLEVNPDPEFDLITTTCDGQPCFNSFNIEVCMTYGDAGRGGLGNTLEIDYTLELDPQLIQAGLPSRVVLYSDQTSSVRSGSYTLTQKNRTCISDMAILKTLADVTSPFVVQFTPRLVDNRTPDPTWDGNMALNSLQNAPVLSLVGETVATTQLVQNCSGNVCRPNLAVMVLNDSIRYEDNNGDAVLGANSIVSGIITSVEIPVMVVNKGDNSFGARISVTFDSVLIFSRAVPQGGITLTCSTDRGADNSSASCPIASQFSANESSVIVFRFQTNAVRGSEMELKTVFMVSGQPSENETTSGDNTARHNFVVEANADLRIQVSLQPETIVLGETNPSQISYIMDFAPSSSIIDVTFSITNGGTTRVPSAELTIFWPFNSPDDSQYYLYPIQANGLSCETDYINRDNLELMELVEDATESPGKRRRRQAQPASVSNSTQVSCIDGAHESCVAIVCDITDIDRSARLTIQAIPDNRQFFGTVNNWEFTIHAEVKILSTFINENTDNNDDSVTVMGSPVITPTSTEEDGIAAWVIIVPILIGVLIIIAIVVALYFLGFFKLKKVDKDQEELNQDGEVPDGEKPEASEL